MMSSAIAILYSGLVLGSIFAASAVGLAMIYGTLRFLNLAHGAFLVTGGYMAWLVAHTYGLPLYVGILAAAAAGSLLGLAVYLLMLRPLLGSERWATATIIASVGLAIFLEAAILLLFGPRIRALPPALSGGVQIGTTVVTYNSLFVGAVAVVLLVATHLFLARTRHGIAIRAVSEDINAAYLMGIPSRRVFAAVAAVSGGLAAVAGVLLSSFYLLRPDAGLAPMLIAIVVVVFGGLGSIKGTIVAAYAIGLLQASVSVLLGAKWALPALFAFVILVLIFRPYGLYGKPEEARV